MYTLLFLLFFFSDAYVYLIISPYPKTVAITHTHTHTQCNNWRICFSLTNQHYAEGCVSIFGHYLTIIYSSMVQPVIKLGGNPLTNLLYCQNFCFQLKAEN